MKKIKIFTGRADEVEHKIQAFLNDGHVIESLTQSVSNSGDSLTITLIYSEKISFKPAPIFRKDDNLEIE